MTLVCTMLWMLFLLKWRPNFYGNYYISFISKWKKIYNEQGVGGLILKYKGSKSYLDKEQRTSVISWLQQKNYWHLQELVSEIEDKYEVIFASKQSYYNLFEEAGISWKKTQMSNPKKDPELVQKKSRNNDLAGKP